MLHALLDPAKMVDLLAFPWVLVCSVPNEDIIPNLRYNLRSFAIWLTKLLQQKAVEYGCTHRFDKQPKAIFYTTPGNEVEVRKTYSAIHQDYPEVMVVIHILPVPNSLEYRLMKELADKYDLIRQGILLENAINQFEEGNMENVIGNILQWFNRCMSRFVALEEKNRSNFTLLLGQEDHCINLTSFAMTNVIESVQKVLHGKDDTVFNNSNMKSVVEVYGYPLCFNEFDIANIFKHYRIVKVVKNANKAMVQFVNEIHAVQAILEYNEIFIDSEHILSVLPTHPTINEQVKIALSDKPYFS
ncbi:unnamed protein product [Thelazia callipaeda]|uniref:RRM domain-containing protein n=1 Tax=Thelazia callipaeda TaxID=103827 RepID=A0A0N5D7S5_THECL|nr:unnamed protein product [Thelazia callipaeda]